MAQLQNKKKWFDKNTGYGQINKDLIIVYNKGNNCL